MKRIVVIGGGASGLASAIAAAEAVRTAGLTPDDVTVSIFEMDARVGRRILATGNGRCNFSNSSMSPYFYDNGTRFVKKIYQVMPPQRVWDFFTDLGLVWTEGADGRLLPSAGKASVVVDVLRARAAALGVEECCEARVRKLTPPKSEGKLWTLTMDDGHFERASAVVVATGGQDALDFLPEDVEVYPFAPVLGPLKTDTTLIRALDNIRVKCRVTLMRDGEFEAEEQGELLFRKYGVSGICVFDLSSVAEPGDVLEIDFLPDEKEEKIANLLASRRRRLLAYEPEACMADLFRGLLLPSVAEAVCAAAGVDAAAKAQSLTKAQKDAFARALKHFPLTVEGIADPAQCQVHRGGVDGYELSSEMEYATHPGLYFAGEAVDVDGPCGGYNLHWAWASGLVAGSAAARSVIKKSGPV